MFRITHPVTTLQSFDYCIARTNLTDSLHNQQYLFQDTKSEISDRFLSEILNNNTKNENVPCVLELTDLHDVDCHVNGTLAALRNKLLQISN